jgi:hypothetical protein
MFQLGPLPLKVDFVIHELFILVTGPYRSTYTSRVFGSLLLLAWLALHIQSRTGQVRLTHGQVCLTHATAFRLTHAMASCLVAHTQIVGSDAECVWLLAPSHQPAFLSLHACPACLSAPCKLATPGTPIIFAWREPGRRTAFAPERSSPNHRSGNQSHEACTY